MSEGKSSRGSARDVLIPSTYLTTASGLSLHTTRLKLVRACTYTPCVTIPFRKLKTA